LQDLSSGVENHDKGAKGMSAEQVLSAAILEQTECPNSEEQAFHLSSPRNYRKFCKYL
jgi:hypothetical protein